MKGPNSTIVPLNIPVLDPNATWPNAAQPSSQSPMYKMNNNQINDAVRVLIFALYGLTLNILQSNDGINWSSLYSEANSAAQLLDSGWINPTMRYFQVQIVNGATQQGGDIYANAQQTNPAPIDARLALYMQEPETISGITDVALSGSITEVQATLQNDGSGHYYTSAPINLTNIEILWLIMPAAWVAAVISFQTSDSQTGTFQPLYDDSGNEIQLTVAAGHNIACVNNAIACAGFAWVKLNSGSNSALVDQTAARTISVLGKM